ncbi:hypothetical protein [Paraflavitalea pollutisoli]|uniref:hypothetical protein n=1 Tax=Paraflavitalea pollutisoli TaxID=3034143 RepID=UPI0023EC3A0F|nr:hypothetical protein [Paraflavitalea sp. H1-2-19X]
MKKLLIMGCFGMASCQEATTTVPHLIKDAEERRQKSDSIMKAFKEVNESIKASNKAVPGTNDSALQRLDSLAKGVGAFK